MGEALHFAHSVCGGIRDIAYSEIASAGFQRDLRAGILRGSLFSRRHGLVASAGGYGRHRYWLKSLLLSRQRRVLADVAKLRHLCRAHWAGQMDWQSRAALETRVWRRFGCSALLLSNEHPFLV